MSQTPSAVWNNCLSFIKDNIQPQAYKTWFVPIIPVKVTNDVLSIQVPSKFFYEWLEEHYVKILRIALTKELGPKARLVYIIKMENTFGNKMPFTEKIPSSSSSSIKSQSIESPFSTFASELKNPFVIPGIRNLQIESQLNPNYTFENFLEGDSNRLARSAGIAVSNKPGGTSFNPLLIYGGGGLGKTHLAHAIGVDIKQKYPDVPVVSYVNTSADVKAETDVCCTSANAVKVVESLNVEKVIFLPDQYLANYVAKNTKVKIISWKGTCIVHEQFTGKEIEDIKSQNPGIKIIAHPECPPDVIKASDFAGSTSGMVKYVKDNQPKKVMLVTECSMSDNVEADNPNVSFIKPCNLCPYMKKIDLEKILDCLENETNEILLDDKTIEAARKSVIRMTEIGR